MNLDSLKQSLVGQWASIAPELRPSSLKAADGSIKPFYLTRAFSYQADDRFALNIVNFADAQGLAPLARLGLKGHIVWQGDHPIVAGAQKVQFIADQAYTVEPAHPGFVDVLNHAAAVGFDKWELGRAQSILRKAFPVFGLAEGENFSEYDLIFLEGDFLFWGARHVDGRGFDSEANRPTNLQIPLLRQA